MAEAPGARDDTLRQQAAGGISLRELDKLHGVERDWYRLGLQLGVRADDLNTIEKNYPRDASMCKIKMFAQWQRCDTNPTYKTLVRALATVGNRKLAESVCNAQGISLSVLDDTDAINTHQSQSFISGPRVNEEAIPSPDKVVSLFRGSDHEVLAPQDQNDTSSSFPYLDIRKLSEQEKLALHCELLKDSDKIMREFNDLTHYTIKSMDSRCVSVQELHTRLSGLGTYNPILKEVPLLQDQLDAIERAENVEGVFSILHQYYSFFNYTVVEMLIGWFGTTENKERLEIYMENFKRFCKRRTFECPPNIFGPVDKEKTNLVVKVEKSWGPAKACPLETVVRFRISLGDILGVKPWTLHLCRIDDGCMELMFQVPYFVEEDIFPLSVEQERSLTAVGVTRLTCGNYMFLKPSEELVPQLSSQAETQKRDHSQMEGSIPEISFSDLEVGEQLGEGAFGVIYRGHWKSRAMDVAIKRVPGKINRTEIEILNMLKHPCIIQFHGVVVDSPAPPEHYIITELAEGGSLYDLLHQKNYRPSKEESLKWAAEIAQGMKYLHQKKMMHRDLKSSNVLLTSEGNIKICDFGGAKHFDYTTRQTETGTYRWMAPEVMKGEPVSLSSDVFSYGMLLFEILTGELPFADAKTDLVVSSKIMLGEIPSIPDSMDSYLAKTLKQCWNANPKARLSFPDILEILTKRAVGRKRPQITDPADPEHITKWARILQGNATGQQQITIREISWRTGSDTPEDMRRGAAVSHGKMAYFNSDGSTSVYCYNSQGELWQKLCDCHSTNSALVMAEGNLTTVGGEQDGGPTNSLASLTGEGEDSKWVELFPQMPTARYCLAAVCRGKNVIAAGGYDGGRRLSTVEILDIDLRQWFSATSLPHPMSWGTITVCEELLYLLGGCGQNGQTLSVLTSSITDLLHQHQERVNQLAVWRKVADVPYYGSTAVSVGGQLLAIGGWDEDRKNTSAIVAYDPTSDSWQDMGHMTTPRWRPLVAVLPSNELIVAQMASEEKLK